MMGQAKQMFLTALKIQMDYHNHTWVLPPRLHKKKLSLSAQGMSQHHTASRCQVHLSDSNPPCQEDRFHESVARYRGTI